MLKRLRSDIDFILARDPAARSRREVLTCYPGLHALWLHRGAHALWCRGWLWAARWVSHWGRWLTGIEIHPGAVIGENVFIDHGMGVVIGETAVIGDGCTIYQGVTLGGTALYKGTKRHPTLGRGVVVGAGAKVLGGFAVGDGARIGSNAVVVKPVPAGATAAGIPARIIPGKGAAHAVDVAVAGAGQPAAPARAPTPAAPFTAYGVTQEEDPVNLLIRRLSEGAAAHEQQIALLWQALAKLSADCLPKENQRPQAFEKEKIDEILGK